MFVILFFTEVPISISFFFSSGNFEMWSGRINHYYNKLESFSYYEKVKI